VGVLTGDRTIPTPRLLEIARRFGWYGRVDGLRVRRSVEEQQLCARIDAELWLAALRKGASDSAFYFGEGASGAARLLLGRGPIILSRILPPEPHLRQKLAQLALHYRWISAHFDATRIETARKISETYGTVRVRLPKVYYILALPVFLAWIIGAIRFYIALPLVYVVALLARAPFTARALFMIFVLFGSLGLAAFLSIALTNMAIGAAHPWRLS
jgi:hypothetical protein